MLLLFLNRSLRFTLVEVFWLENRLLTPWRDFLPLNRGKASNFYKALLGVGFVVFIYQAKCCL